MNRTAVLLVMALLLVGQVAAWMPPTHYMIQEASLAQAPNSPVGLVVKNNWDDFVACQVLADISVFYYFSEGFTSIGKQYKATHSTSLCRRLVELAENDEQLSCAYGVCSHHTADAIAHNKLVPQVIRATRLPNGIVHALAEEKVNDLVRKPKYDAAINHALISKSPVHKDFIIGAIRSGGGVGSVDLEAMYDAFVAEVTGNSKYSVGFRGFTAVPISIHVMLLLIFLLNVMMLSYFYKLEDKTLLNKLTMLANFALVLLIFAVYALFFSGKLWLAFQTFSYPLSQPIPIQGYQGYISESTSETVKLFNGGADYVNTIADPAGAAALSAADAAGASFRNWMMAFIAVLIAALLYLNVGKKNTSTTPS